MNELYASVASQSATAPYLQGFVGAGNRIEIDRLPQGTYRLVVRPADSDPVELTFAADSQEIDMVLRLDNDQIVAGRTDQTATERGMPDNAPGAHESPEAVHEDNVPVVTGLPNTGMSGIREPGIAALMIGTGLFAALLTVAGAFHRRRND